MALDKFTVTPTVTAGAYTALDCIGGRQQLKGAASRRCVVERTILVDTAGNNVDYYIAFYDAVPTDVTDNNPFAPARADNTKVLATIPLTAASMRFPFQTGSMHQNGIWHPELISAEDDGDIWFFLWSPGAPTYGNTGDLSLIFELRPT